MALKFVGVCLVTRNVPRLAQFYVHVLGAQAEGDETHVELRTAGAQLTIFSFGGMERMTPGSMYGARGGNVTLGFEVQDIARADLLPGSAPAGDRRDLRGAGGVCVQHRTWFQPATSWCSPQDCSQRARRPSASSCGVGPHLDLFGMSASEVVRRMAIVLPAILDGRELTKDELGVALARQLGQNVPPEKCCFGTRQMGLGQIATARP